MSTSDRESSASTMSVPSTRPGLLRTLAHRLAGDADVLPVEGHLPSFDGATRWLNSEPLTPQGLRGRVVLVDFWTYTCINWLRTLPYRRAWAAKYADAGLTVIGVHTPEFGFEQDIDNVVAQSRTFGVEYPIAVDSKYGVWEAFANHFWPAVYIADAEGRIRYHHFGEGEYAMIEMVVQQLLLEAGAPDVDPDLVAVEPKGFEIPADWATLRSPETYLAFGRSAGFASPDQARFNQPYTLSRAIAARHQPVGAVRDVDASAARRRGGRGRRTHRVPLPGPRRQPGDGTAETRSIRTVPRASRRAGARQCPRLRRRRARQRHAR